MTPGPQCGTVCWLGAALGSTSTTDGFRVWRWTAAESAARPVSASALADRDSFQALLQRPSGTHEPGWGMVGPAGPLLALGRNPVRQTAHRLRPHHRLAPLVNNTPDPPYPDDPGPPEPVTWTWTDPTGITHTDTYQPALPADG